MGRKMRTGGGGLIQVASAGDKSYLSFFVALLNGCK
jgi:hypothetical protein